MANSGQLLPYRHEIGLKVEHLPDAIRITAPSYGFARSAELQVTSWRFWFGMGIYCLAVGWRGIYEWLQALTTTGGVLQIRAKSLVLFLAAPAFMALLLLAQSAENGMVLTMDSETLSCESRGLFGWRSSKKYARSGIREVKVSFYGVRIKLSSPTGLLHHFSYRVILRSRVDQEHQYVAAFVTDWLKDPGLVMGRALDRAMISNT